ncbi:MAG: AMP-binding protein, partial [bacterium]|nr:AMP-binding protein [bacterium]
LEAAGPGREENPAAGSSAGNLAYLLYTSGSTGRPKGVACSPVGGIDLLADFAARAPLHPGDGCSWWTSLNFDVSVYEIFSPLVAGGSLRIVPEAVRADGERFVAWLREARIRSAYVTPSMLPELASRVRDEPGGFALRRLLVGVEPIAETLLAAIGEAVPGLRIINGYGPTEATICATLHSLREDAIRRPQERNVPIGRPPRNTEIYLLDRDLRPTPPGVPGEVFIGGDGLARGYHRRPQRTAERFVPSPFGDPGARLYRTGDRAKALGSGELMFLGRLDYQAKVRGFRIEPGEVEAALARHPGVREAVVVIRGGERGDRQLVAYAVREKEAAELAAGDLRAYLGETLPAYMVPSRVVFLDALPLGPSGKVDRGALPDPDAGGLGDWVAPRGPFEEILAGIWSEVFGSDRISAGANFFDLGGHSLLGTQVASRVNRAFGVAIGLSQLFERPTLTALAAEIGRLSAAAQGMAQEPLGALAGSGPVPLSSAQQRLWFLHHYEPGSTAYNLATPLHFQGSLDPEALRRSFAEIIRRHEILRTTFTVVGEQAVQVPTPSREHPLPWVDLTALGKEDRSREVERLILRDEARPFDLVHGPLFRHALLHLDREEHVLLLCCHHIIFDGWSQAVVIRELAPIYRAFLAGRPSPLAPPAIQYRDFAAWQQRWLRGHEPEAQLAYWRSQLGSAQPVATLAPDHPRRPGSASWARRRQFTVGAATTEALRGLGRGQGATLFMTLAAAFQTLLHRHTGAPVVTVGTPIAHRNRCEIEELIGFFVNTQVMRSDFSDDPPFRRLLDRVRETTLGAYAHQDLPFDKLVEALHPARRAEDRQPFFQALFVLQNAPLPPLELPGVTLHVPPVKKGERAAMFDLTLGMRETGETIDGAMEYDGALFEAATIDTLVDQYRRLLEEIVAHPERRVSELELPPAPDRKPAPVAAAEDADAAGEDKLAAEKAAASSRDWRSCTSAARP